MCWATSPPNHRRKLQSVHMGAQGMVGPEGFEPPTKGL